MARGLKGLLVVGLLGASGGRSLAGDEPTDGGKRVTVADLPDIKRPTGPAPTTAELAPRGKPDPDRVLPGNLRITTRCEDGCCVDGLMAGDRVLFAAKVTRDDRRTCRHGWLERVVRVAFQDDAVVSIYLAESWFTDGAAHANNVLRCRTFDLKTGRQLVLHDVLRGARGARALARARRALRDSLDDHAFTATATGIRFQGGVKGGRDILFCAEGPYPLDSGSIDELAAR